MSRDTTSSAVEVQRVQQELSIAKRELSRLRETYELEKARWEADNSSLRTNYNALQGSIDNVTQQRNRDSRERSELFRQMEGLRAENAKLRKEVSAALDTKLSHLRSPQVSFEQYRELLQLTEHYASLLKNGASGVGADQEANVAVARDWVDRMASAPFAASTPREYMGGSMTQGDEFTMSKTNAFPAVSRAMTATLSENGQDASPQTKEQQETQQDKVVQESIVEGGKLIKLIRDATPHQGKQWSFNNATIDTQFILEFVFGPMSDVTTLGDTEREGRTFRLNLYPGETKQFVRGIINGYKMAVKYGPPDESFIPPSCTTDKDLAPVVSRVGSIFQQVQGVLSAVMNGCIAEGIPFIDTEFPPLSVSISRNVDPRFSGPDLQWMQPKAILPPGRREELCGSCLSPGTIVEGQFAGGWLSSALAMLAEDPNLIRRIFSRSVTSEQLNGLYRVWLCINGMWQLYNIDSFIPCLDRKPYGIQQTYNRELWATMVEKAMARAYGSYTAISTGDAFDALQDITGFPIEVLDWKQRETSLFNQIQKLTSNQGSIVGLVTGAASDQMDSKKVTNVGLLPAHTYRLLAAVSVEGFRMCLVRNPFPSATPGKSWAGAWSEKSEMWQRHPAVQDACDFAVKPFIHSDGSVLMWMEWRDVCNLFDGAGVCFVFPQWSDIRIPNRFFGTRPTFLLEISVNAPTSIAVGLHQTDKRGLEQSDPDSTYSAFLLTVVGKGSSGMWDTIAQSHNGNFWRGRDTYLELQLVPSDHAYYVLPRRHSADGVKDVTLSLHVEKRKNVSITLRQPTDAVLVSVKYSPVWKFDPTPCQEIQVECQVDREEMTNTL